MSQNPGVTSFPDSSPAPAPGAQDAPAGSAQRVLVVDDNADAAETLAELLGFDGYEVRAAPDAEAALQLLESFEPAVALLDIGLPGMDGYELARLLRANPRTSRIKLVALTGYDRDSAASPSSDFDEHLVKPVVFERVLEVLRQLTRRPA